MNELPVQKRALRTTATTACLALLLGVLAVFLAVPSAGAAEVVAPRCDGYRGARALGTTYTDSVVKIYACGVRPSFDGAKKGTGPVVRPFAGSTIYYRGYQCIELVARYLMARYGAAPGVANGAQAVDRYAAAYPKKFVKIANGTRRKAPRRGDVLSLSAHHTFSGVGHTGIVISSSVSSAGNGTIKAMEENWGGPGGTRGYHTYPVRSWRVQFPGLPYIKWLRAR
jgi:hypothetical protein